MSETRLIWVEPGALPLSRITGDDKAGHRTTWWPLLHGGIVVRWLKGEDEDAVLHALNKIPDGTLKPSGEVTVPRGGLTLLGPENAKGRLRVPLEEGRYAVESGEYKPDARTHLVLYRLRRA